MTILICFNTGNISVSSPIQLDEVGYLYSQSNFPDYSSFTDKHLEAFCHFIAESKLSENEDEVHINVCWHNVVRLKSNLISIFSKE